MAGAGWGNWGKPMATSQEDHDGRQDRAGNGANLILMVIKGIGELLRGGAKGEIEGKASNGHQDRPDGNNKNCCRFHKVEENGKPLHPIILRTIKVLILVRIHGATDLVRRHS